MQIIEYKQMHSDCELALNVIYLMMQCKKKTLEEFTKVTHQPLAEKMIC